MKKKIAVMLCGILLFTMLPAGCGNAGAQAGDQGAAEQVSDGKTQDESEEQEKLSDAKDDKSDAGKEAAADKDTGDSGAEKADRDNPQDGRADMEATNNTGGSKSGGVADGNSSNGTGGKNSSSVTSGGNGSSGGSTGNTSGGNVSNGSGTSGSGSNTGNTGSGNASSNTGNTSGGTSTSQPEHTHSWVEQTTTVTHEATGHYETVVVKDAWDEPVYEMRELNVCNVCGKVIEGDPAYHGKEHALAGEGGGHHSEWTQVQTGTIHHEAQTQEVWVEDSPARTETVGTGSYICSSCGAAK